MNDTATSRAAALPPRFDPKDFEERLYREWEASGHFSPTGDRGKPYTIVIPPPNVTGRLHVGHALVNTLQDVLIRWRRMQGYDALWLPGTDHAGISTQMVVERELAKDGIRRLDLGREKFEARVWEWKKEYGSAITMQLRRIGVSCDWTRERFTLDADLSRAVKRVFVSLHAEGLIYRDRYIVNWCPRCRTAISDLEVEYRESDGKLWSIDYPRADGTGFVRVATTRPETMLGDTAVAVHPDDERYRDLVGRELVLPIVGRRIPVVADSFVDPAFGTGAVKVTPAHDPNDFACARRNGLPDVQVIGPDGHMTAEAGEGFVGLDRFEARRQVVARLEELGALAETKPYKNSVGRCAKCDTVVEPYLSWQWFVKIAPLAEPAIAAVEDGRTEIVPKLWEKTYFEWMRNLHDWCISRQLWWGHRIPAWYCDCGAITVAEETPTACVSCGGTALRQDEDVLDTWFSSGLWAFSTFGWPDDTPDLRRHTPTDVLVTGFDILFFWVARMMMLSLKFTGDVPFRKVFLHGLVRDEKGQKMSKTKGNIVDPLDIIDEFGADAVRFTLAVLSGTGRDIPFAKTRLAGYRAFATKVWNAARFALGFVEESDRTLPPVPPRESLGLPERWLLGELDRTAGDVSRHLEAFRFDEAAQAIYHFVWDDLCDWYLEMSKPVLQGRMGSDADRAAAKAVLLHALETALRMLHPFMPFVTEEIWRQLPGNEGKTLLVAPFPAATGVGDEEADRAVARFQQVVTRVRNLRAEQKIAPGDPLRLFLPSDDSRAALAPFSGLFPVLAKCSLENGEAPAGARSVRDRIDGVEFVLELPVAAVDPKEREKLERELESIAKEVAANSSKLENPDFVARAPQAVVEKSRARIAELLRRAETIRGNLADSGGGRVMMTRPAGLERFENILVFDRVPSTQDLARQVVSTLDDDEVSVPCTVVAARRQSKGRGRGDRGWFSPAGGLYLTMVLPVASLEAALHRPLAASVVLAEALRATFAVDAAIKWPNDVLCGGRKVAGLLLEHIARKAGPGSLLLVGLGLNLERGALADGGEATGAAVALDELTGREVGFDEALTAVLQAFAREESAPRGREEILARWRELAIHRPGDELRVRLGDGRESTGRFAGLDEVGRLELETAAGIERIASADLVP